MAATFIAVLGGCEQAPPPLVTRPPGPPPRTRITNVFIIDGRSPILIPPQDVILEGGRIKAIVGRGLLPAEGELVIDGTSRILMPGLIDVHGHRAPPARYSERCRKLKTSL